MANGPSTQISDIIVPEVFNPYMQLLTEQKSRIIQSGVAVRSQDLDNKLAGGGITFNVPFFNDLDDDEERVSTDDSAPFAGPYSVPAGTDAAGGQITLPNGQAFDPDPKKLTTGKEIAVRMERNQSWSSSDLAAIVAGADPMNAIAERVAAYWVRREQAAFVSMWNGVIADNTANDAGDLTHDISGASFVDGTTNFSAASFLDATLTMGDSMEDLTGMFVHSVVYNRMQKNNLIDFIPDATGRVNIPTFLGREVLVDDSMPRTGNVFDTWLFGAASCQIGVGTPKVPTEVGRKPGAGNGGGQDVLYSRKQMCLHPTGHAFIGASDEGGPTNAELAAGSSWDRRYPERKQIKFARLVTREA